MKTKILIVLAVFVLTALLFYKKPEQVAEHSESKPDIEIRQIEIKKEITPEFIRIPLIRTVNDENRIYNDVIGHSPDAPFGNNDGKSTNVHETVHGINSYYRNKQHGKVNALYCLNGNLAIIEEPNVTIDQVSRQIPVSLREYRYQLYLVEQKHDWNNRPLYLFDEWSAYIAGSSYNINNQEDNQKWTDGVSGPLEFSIYSIYLAITIKKHDPYYYNNNQQFKKFLIYNLKLSQEIYKKGCNLPQFKWEKQEKLLENLKHNEDAKEIRKFIIEELDGIFLH